MKLNEQTVLVTGGSRGLGASIVKSFAREGANVILNYYQSEDAAVLLAHELGDNVLAVQADVRCEEQVQRMVEQGEGYFGKPVTTLVNNALIDFQFNPSTQKPIEDLSWADFLKQLEGSIEGALLPVQACLPGMKAASFGRIINIGTNLVQNPVVAYHEYTTGKAGLLGLTRNMAKELGQYGITANMISGGLLRETDASSVTTDEVFGIIEATTPLGKVTTPEELADVTLFFASDWSRAVTGQNLIVDGGLVMNG